MTTIEFSRNAAIAALILVSGCAHRTPDATVEVIDTSLSITPRAEKAVLDAVREQIRRMHRGDRLIVIPITGDAQNDAGGRILRLSAPSEREAYDSDLRRFQEQAGKQFSVWVASLDAHPSRTDILGALDAARQELELLSGEGNRKLVVASDFLEDDGTYRFVSAESLKNQARAREVAARLRKQHGFELSDVTLCLGRLESSDFRALTAQRKEAVNTFWEAYFAEGTRQVSLQVDGLGLLESPEKCGMPHEKAH
jgi:hypothetical protein